MFVVKSKILNVFCGLTVFVVAQFIAPLTLLKTNNYDLC